MQTLLIADSSEELRTTLSQALQGQFHVLTTDSGTEALSLLRSHRPQLLVLDLMLPYLDGISLLEQAAAEGCLTNVLVVSAVYTDYVLQASSRLGIAYTVRKPCDPGAVLCRIRDLAGVPSGSRKPPSVDTAGFLRQLGFSARHDGYRYLLYILPLQRKEPQLGVTKLAYPAAARQFGCTRKNAERAIRTAIEAAWKHGSRELWEQYFPSHTARPTNAEFIALAAEVLGSDPE